VNTELAQAPSLRAQLRSELGRLWPSSNGLYAGRTCLAAMLALYLAYALELDNAFSAATTVLIVASPMHGMVWAKSFYRAAGTVIGGLAAILLTAAFGQQPELFLLGFGVWMGLCTAASTLLRSFRSYGAILAGYTVGLIAFPNLPAAPDSVFTLVVARVSTVLLGIACSAVVGSLLTSRNGAQLLEQRLRNTLAEMAALVRLALHPQPWGVLEQARHRLRADIAGVDALVEFASAEGTRIGGLIEAQRASVAGMLAALTATAGVQDAVVAIGPAQIGPLDDLAGHLGRLAAALGERHGLALAAEIDTTLTAMTALKAQLEERLAPRDFTRLRLFDRLDELLDDLAIALRGLSRLLRGEAGPKSADRPAFHVEWRWAAINGLRAALAVWLASALWIGTAWPAGGMLVGTVVPNVGLLSLRDRPDLDAMEFVKGISLAIVAGLFCLLFVLPQLTGFPLLALTLGGFLFWGILQTTNPQRTFLGIGFMVFFMTLLAPSNVMRYDIASYLNIAMATVSAAGLTAVVHRTILPMRPLTHVRNLLNGIRSDLWRLARYRQATSPGWAVAWETRMHDRLIRLSGRLRIAGLPLDKSMRNAHAALRLGRELLRLRGLLAGLVAVPGARATGRVVLRGLAGLSRDPRRAVRLCRLAAARLGRLAAGQSPEIGADLNRAATSLIEIALLLGRHRRFFRQGGPPC